jgi:SAM-dependent methyltransferase
VLEIGVGQGAMGALLADRFDYTGIELDEDSFSAARQLFQRCGHDPGRLLLGGLETVSGRTFDLVCAFEVIEHFAGDREALEEWRSFVADGGALMLSAPAGRDRFGPADERAGHFRRYDRSDLIALLTAANFTDIEVLNYGFPAGYVLEAVRNAVARRTIRTELSYQERTLSSARWLQPPQRAARLTHALSLPLIALQGPFMRGNRGTGLVAAARRG